MVYFEGHPYVQTNLCRASWCLSIASVGAPVGDELGAKWPSWSIVDTVAKWTAACEACCSRYIASSGS